MPERERYPERLERGGNEPQALTCREGRFSHIFCILPHYAPKIHSVFRVKYRGLLGEQLRKNVCDAYFPECSIIQNQLYNFVHFDIISVLRIRAGRCDIISLYDNSCDQNHILRRC